MFIVDYIICSSSGSGLVFPILIFSRFTLKNDFILYYKDIDRHLSCLEYKTGNHRNRMAGIFYDNPYRKPDTQILIFLWIIWTCKCNTHWCWIL